MQSPSKLRQRLKQRRAKLSAIQQHLAAVKIARKAAVNTTPQRVASYLAFGHELQTKPLNYALIRQGHQVFVPVIRKQHQMSFVRFAPFAKQYANQYGIPEPRFTPQREIAPSTLQTVLVPLVGFDQQGNRLGMGGGYYDRWLKKTNPHADRVGLAHDCQRCRRLKPEPWDQPLQRVITPTYQINRQKP